MYQLLPIKYELKLPSEATPTSYAIQNQIQAVCSDGTLTLIVFLKKSLSFQQRPFSGLLIHFQIFRFNIRSSDSISDLQIQYQIFWSIYRSFHPFSDLLINFQIFSSIFRSSHPFSDLLILIGFAWSIFPGPLYMFIH